MANATTSGSWSKMSKSLPRLAGMSSNQVNWGIPANRARRQSGYRFVGRKVPLHLDGKEFVLGTFTHNNFPISLGGPNQLRFSIDLGVKVIFDDGDLKRNFNFTLNHTETPNRGSRMQQADRVEISTVTSSETIEINGDAYAVEIVGFKQKGEIVKEFISFENAANSAVIVAKLVHIPDPETETEPQVTTTYTFDVLNPDGTAFGKGCFTYTGDEVPIDLAHIISGNQGANQLTSFWYHDPLVGIMNMSQLMSMNFVHGVEGEPSKFTLNAANVPDDTHALAAGIATPAQVGSVSVHRNGGENFSCSGRKISFPTPCYHKVQTGSEIDTKQPVVDLVVVIDSSVSMRPEAITLSNAISAAIESAKSSCPSDLKVTYLGLEGRFSDSLFDTTIRQHLTALGVAESDMRGRKRGSVEAGGAQEDGGRAIEDVSLLHNWRADAERSIFYLSDEGLEGGDTVNKDDIEAATKAIDVATTENVRVHTYLADSKAKPEIRQSNETEFERVASSTGGQFFNAQDLTEGFQDMLQQVICASAEPTGIFETAPCPCNKAAVESTKE